MGDEERMGPLLRKEVESQLLKDLAPYGIDPKGLVIDWSCCCIEGHCTQVLDGELENFSGVTVVNSDGQAVAEGWMQFIHGGGDNPLFVFWMYLTVVRNGEQVEVKDDPNIPGHIWAKLPEKMKRLCTKTNEYDGSWGNDPLVLAWKRSQS
jgi:hypothetical protein